MNRASQALLIAVSAGSLLLGCGPSHGKDKDDGLDGLRAALDSPDGELGATSEAVVASDYDDIEPAVVTDDSTSVEPSGWSRSLSVLLLWGHRPLVEGVDPSTSTDWTGTIQVSEGNSVRVAAKVGFVGEDKVAPRVDPTVVDFISHTAGTVDGLLLQVLQRTPDATVSIQTATGSSLTIALASIRPDLSGAQPVGTSDFLSFHAFATSNLCKDGVVFGRFRRLGAGIGRLHARVIDDTGVEVGRVRGLYGHSNKWDVDVLFGKYLHLDGTYGGRLKGTYADGAFAGEWRWDLPLEAGKFVGHYWEGPPGVKGRGLLFGHWIEQCPGGGQ